MPVSLATSGTHRFDVGDIIDVNATISNLTQMGTGHYQFELSPDDNSSPANLFVKIDGSGVKTDGFGDTFQDANFSFDYNPQNPVILSSTFSHWARGVHSSFAIHTLDASSVALSALPSGLEYNASSK